MTKQRETFDQVAALYDEVRSQVPSEAVEALWRELALSAGDGVVEVGCGTGQLTKHLLARGARVVALEPGAALARICTEKLADYELTVVGATFEDWSPGDERYAAVAAVQAAHWIEPQTFLDRAVDALAPEGRVALIWHLDISQDTDFWQATQPLYDRYLPDAPTKPPRTIPLHVAAYERAFRDDARFESLPTERWPWTRAFDEQTYLKLLMTHSPVRLLAEADRRAFLDGHRDLIRQLGGRVDRHYETVLLVAPRR